MARHFDDLRKSAGDHYLVADGGERLADAFLALGGIEQGNPTIVVPRMLFFISNVPLCSFPRIGAPARCRAS